MTETHLSIDAALVLGEDWDAGGGVVIRQPTSGEIIRWGEDRYYHIIGLLTCISSDCKATLYDMGIMWDDVSDFDMFCIATRGLTPQDTGIILGDELDLSALHFYVDKNGSGSYLADDNGTPVITHSNWQSMHDFLCRMHNINKKPEFPGNDFARTMLLEESRMAMAEQTKEFHPVLPSVVSYIANAPGTKYGYKECLELKYSTFMDCLARTQIISEATALRSACLSGMIDTSKINKENMNMLRDIKPREADSPFTENID